MTERIILTLVIAAAGLAAFLLVRTVQMRRATAAIGRGQGARGRPAILYFRSDACAPCRTQAQFLQQIAAEYGDRVVIEKVDADAAPERAQAFGVFTLPTTLIVDACGEVRHANYGLTDAGRLKGQLAALRACEGA